jgi:hypothetical protein
MIFRWLSLLAARAVFLLALRTAAALALAAVLIAAAPVTLVAAGAAGAAWLTGSPARRLYRAAAGCAPMTAVWLAATAAGRGWPAMLTAPYHAWLVFWRSLAAGSVVAAAAVIVPAAVPLGLLAGGLAWSYRLASLATGTGGLSPGALVSFDARLWRHQVRSARARIAAPGAVPLTTRSGDLVPGAVIRAVGHPARPIARLPYQRTRSHQVIIGTTGSGKTSLLLRLWAGFLATALQRHAAGRGRPPLLVVLDCKGGADARRIADRARRVFRETGARGTAVWPDEASLSLWVLPPDQLITTLADLIEHGTGAAAYYADVLEAVVQLAVQAPSGPPVSTSDFISRLDTGWLTMAYSGDGHDAEHALIHAAGRQIGDIALRYRTLFRRLGGGLDGPGTFADADAWYCILEGTTEIAVAEAQARALVDLLASYAVRHGDREILLAVDEFSAVSRRLPVWELYERARSLGLAIQISSQSWQGLAATEDERYRIATTADGGIWLLRTPHPEPVTALAGTRQVTETARWTRRPLSWSHRGSSRLRAVPVADPELIRRLDVGQAAYIYRGGVTFVQVKRLVASPAAVPAPALATPSAAPAAPLPQAVPAAGTVAGAPGVPDASELLDEAFPARSAPERPA